MDERRRTPGPRERHTTDVYRSPDTTNGRGSGGVGVQDVHGRRVGTSQGESSQTVNVGHRSSPDRTGTRHPGGQEGTTKREGRTAKLLQRDNDTVGHSGVWPLPRDTGQGGHHRATATGYGAGEATTGSYGTGGPPQVHSRGTRGRGGHHQTTATGYWTPETTEDPTLEKDPRGTWCVRTKYRSAQKPLSLARKKIR